MVISISKMQGKDADKQLDVIIVEPLICMYIYMYLEEGTLM